MKVNFYATLRQIVGGKTIDFEITPAATIGSLIQAMVARYPDLRQALLGADGQLAPHVHVFVNGRDVFHLESQMDTVLNEDDSVGVFPAVGGG